MSFRKKILLGLAGFLLVIGGLSAYVVIAAGGELFLARAALSGSLADLSPQEIQDVRKHLVDADKVLDGFAASVLQFVPVVRQNLGAIEDVTESTIPVVDRGLELKQTVDELEKRNLIHEGRVDLDVVADLEAALEKQAMALGRVRATVAEGRSGWLLPPVWTIFDDTLDRIEGLHDSARAGLEATRLAGPLLGSEGRRTYLVVLLNNAELRGAGGIPSGAGTLTVDNGRLELGAFFHTFTLRGSRPFEKVDSAPDFERRFGQYKADTTMWVNTTFSPDVPDVAEVAANLFEVAKGVRTDGAIMIDPRGIASLLPPDTPLELTRADISISAGDLPTYVMSDAYAELGGQGERREILLELGAVAFARVLEGGVGGLDGLQSAGSAVAGGHLRFVSFAPSEAAKLERLDVSGALSPPSSDGLLVTVQNIGADKLDYWARRTIEHVCEIDESSALCSTSVRLTNETPAGLTTYVANKPYGLLRSLLEIYVPAGAEVLAAEQDGETADVLLERQDGYTSLGFLLRVPQGEATTVSVSYSLPLSEEGYSVVATPQPLAFDADLSIMLSVPDDWTVRGVGDAGEVEPAYEGPFADTLRVRAQPSGRTGISSAWQALTTFWNEPLGS